MAGPASRDWPRSAEGVAYPPGPWHLGGTAHLSLWRLRTGELPADRLPRGARPVSVLGRSVIATAWVTYGPDGVLAYDELLAAAPVLAAGRPCATVTHAWVDSPASLAGGRELWGIPKEPAAFRVVRDDADGFEAAASTPDGRPVATLRFRRGASLPGRWRLRLATAQRSPGRGRGGEGLRITGAGVAASAGLGAAAWDFAADGPLAFLRGRRPFTSVRLDGVALRFGR